MGQAYLTTRTLSGGALRVIMVLSPDSEFFRYFNAVTPPRIHGDQKAAGSDLAQRPPLPPAGAASLAQQPPASPTAPSPQ